MAGGFDRLFALTKADLVLALLGALAVAGALFGAGLGIGWLIWG